MPQIEIRNILVDFPYEPYEIQKIYMSKVIECLQNRENGVLESPTGTGKTLSLLCSSLAWLCTERAAFQKSKILGDSGAHSNDFLNQLESDLRLQTGSSNLTWGNALRPPKVIYASRTHSQLNQVMLELKKTSYRHLKVGVLGSRDQLCINPKVSKETSGSKIHMCKLLLSERKCIYYNNLDQKIQDALFQEDRLIDIEDLLKKGKQMNCCPYYASRELQNDASVLFTPYNYLLDPKTRRAQDIKLHTDVVILDEGHNVEKICEESSSTQLSSSVVAVCIKEVTTVMKIFHLEATENLTNSEMSTPKDFTEAELELLKTLFMEIEKSIDNIELPNRKPRTFPASYVFNILEAASITKESITSLQDLLNKICQFLVTVNDSQMHQRGTGLSKFSEFLEIVFNSLGPQHSKEYTDFNYKLYVEMEFMKIKGNSWSTTASTDTGGKTLNFWCFNPGFGMRSLINQGVHSIILTSGTLSPLAATISEIGIPIAVQLSNDHIIKPNQISAVIVDKGPRSTELRCVYSNRSNETYLADLGQTCLNFYKIIPGGVLVFFPSYPFLKACVEFWQQNGTWDRMAALKSIFLEPQTKDQMKLVMDEYYTMVNERGASLFAVCRGKISEGLDFAGNRARAVIVIGLPYPPFNDPRVILKREYLDNGKKKKLSTLDGNEWYQLEAMRAVNQAIGRVIRHASDYGAIIFCDCRFSYPNNVKTLSAWLQSHIIPNCTFGKALNLISSFFRTWKDVPPTKINYEEQKPFSSSYPKNILQPAQKLAPPSINSRTIDYTKLYEKETTGISELKSDSATGSSVKRKSVLESLDEEDSTVAVEYNVLPATDGLRIQNEHCVTSQINLKKRKITIIHPQIYNSCETRTNSEVFDIKKYTLKLQKTFSSEQLKIFREILGEYYKNEDCDCCITKLSALFSLKKDDDLISLYRDIPNFLKTDEHKERFWDSYMKTINRLK